MFARYEARISLSYASMSISKFLAGIMIFAHWMACAWGMLASLEGEDEVTWLDTALKSKTPSACDADAEEYNLKRCTPLGGAIDKCALLFVRHSLPRPLTHAALVADALALYFSVYTLTSVGYGDIAAQNRVEFFFASLCISLSAIYWAYTIGSFCSIVSTSDKHGMIFRQSMDELNFMLSDRNIPNDLRVRCRGYLHQAKGIKRTQDYVMLENQLSMDLRGAVTYQAHHEWLSRVWYLKDANPRFARGSPMP
jgi:hypothetical protein